MISSNIVTTNVHNDILILESNHSNVKMCNLPLNFQKVSKMCQNVSNVPKMCLKCVQCATNVPKMPYLSALFTLIYHYSSISR